MLSDRDLINKFQNFLVKSHSSLITRGPFTTLYWSKDHNDNVVQQQLTVTIDDKTFEILVREKK